MCVDYCDTHPTPGDLQEELYRGLDTHSNFERGACSACPVLPLLL
jgi:hypothetical protein